jgi:hypothetical protein
METNKISISFSGGGIRVMSHCTGVITGFLEPINGRVIRKSIIDFLRKFDIVSGNSGGSWFMSLMMYSPDFLNMLDAGRINNTSRKKIITPIRRLYGYVMSKLPNCICRFWKPTRNTHVRCSADSDNSYDGYLRRMYTNNNIKPITDNVFINWLFDQTFMRHIINFFGTFIYYVGMSWNSVVKELIFNSSVASGDVVFKHNMSETAHDEIKNHCVWATVIMKDASLTETLSMAIDNGDTGMCIPSFFDFNHASGRSEMKIYEGDIKPDLGGEKHIYASYHNQHTQIQENDIKELLEIHTSKSLQVSDVSSISGAAMAILASENVLKQTLAQTPEDPPDTYFARILCDINTVKGWLTNGLISMLTNIFEEMAIPVALDSLTGFKILGGVYEGGCDVGNDNGVNVVTTDECLIDDEVIRFGDGVYADNSSIAYALKTFQKKNKKPVIFHHVNVMSLTHDDSIDDYSQVNKTTEITNLFSYGNDNQDCIDNGVLGFELSIKKPSIFREPMNRRKSMVGENVDGLDLWWGKIGKVSLNIRFFQTTTRDNHSFGILPDWETHLFVIIVTSDDDNFVKPGFDMEDQEHHTDTAVKVNRLMKIARTEFPELFTAMLTNPNTEEYETDINNKVLFLKTQSGMFPTKPTSYLL